MKVQNPITGRSSGGFGNAIAGTWKGINYMRSKPLEVANPQTDAQMKQRSKLAVLVMFARQLMIIIRIGFREKAIKQSAYNAFIKENMNNGFLSFVSSAWTANNPLLAIAKGSLDVTDLTSVSTSNGSSSVTVNYPATASGNQSLGDKLCVVVSTDDGAAQSIGSNTREDGSVVLTFPRALVTGDVLNVYYFFYAANGQKVSDSTYYTKTV